MQAVKEFTKRGKCRGKSCVRFPRDERSQAWRNASAPKGWDCELLLDYKGSGFAIVRLLGCSERYNTGGFSGF